MDKRNYKSMMSVKSNKIMNLINYGDRGKYPKGKDEIPRNP